MAVLPVLLFFLKIVFYFLYGMYTNQCLPVGAEKISGFSCSDSLSSDKSMICSFPSFVTAKVILFSE